MSDYNLEYLQKCLDREKQRQRDTVELIASENFVSKSVLEALGSCFTNKYSEGYPAERVSGFGNKGRYYGGCQNIDSVEDFCCEAWKLVFHTKSKYHVNVQPHSGSQANMAAYMSVLNPGDTILSMSLDNGGHLTHGSPVNFSGKLYNIIQYGVNDRGFIDYEDFREKILIHHPKLVLAGASAYSRTIRFDKMYEMINECSTNKNGGYRPYFMVDMSHIAGLVAANMHQSPFGYADIVTTTTHKTLRGPRGGIIFCVNDLAKKVDSAVFPGCQGGPLQNVILAKAVCACEALDPSFNHYIEQVVKNASAMSKEFIRLGYDVVTGGTDNHMFLIDFSRTHPNLTGKMIQDELDRYDITVNKNCVPNEKRSPVQASGIRIGTPAMTTKYWNEECFTDCARRIDSIIKDLDNKHR